MALLLSYGSDIGLKNLKGKSPRDIAVEMGHRKVIELLDTFQNSNGKLLDSNYIQTTLIAQIKFEFL